jgi:hypothetical protein
MDCQWKDPNMAMITDYGACMKMFLLVEENIAKPLRKGLLSKALHSSSKTSSIGACALHLQAFRWKESRK